MTLVAGVLVLLAVAGVCSLIGDVELTGGVWRLRLYRLAVAALAGGGLAVGGMALQGLLRNPLAEPYVLGISSGAGVGVLAGFALADAGIVAAWLTTPMLALAGALATCAVVYLVAQRAGRLDPYALLLSGVIANAFNGAIMLALFLYVPPRTIPNFAYWAMGRVSPLMPLTSPAMFGVCAAVVVIGAAVLLVRGAAMNALSLGDDVAASTGVAVGRLRVETFVVVAAMTAAAVAISGPIGFVGLIVPHTIRLVVGPDHRRLALCSVIAGAAFLMLADTACRKLGGWFRSGDLPVGIVTAVLGGPFFLVLLRRTFRGGDR